MLTEYTSIQYCIYANAKDIKSLAIAYSQSSGDDWEINKYILSSTVSLLISVWFHILSWACVLVHLRCERFASKAVAPHSSTLAWEIPWTEEPGRLQSVGSLRVGHDWLHFHFSLSCIGEGNGNPLRYSCLENPRDRGACWAAVYGVAQSWTWLMRLSSSRDY